MTRRLIGRRSWLLAAIAGLPLAAMAQPAALRVGLVPYLSTRAMLNVYEPMRKHLETQLGRRVEFYTAAGFGALLDNARDPGQPFTLMPVHLALIAIEDWGFTLVARSMTESTIHIWGPRRLATGGMAAGRGQRVAVIDPMSIVTMSFYRWRAAEKLDDSVRALVYPSLNSALLALANGEVDMVNGAQGQMREAMGVDTSDLAPIVQVGSVTTPAFVAHPDAPAADVAAFRRALLSLRSTAGTGGASQAVFVDGSAADLRPFSDFARAARRMLAEGRPR
ncbi:MAG: hypothetical protein Q7N95_11475 [Alphaproteobacteria bacterium]|nr:hypothetical protein [Alphaproteobacteria bacterium]